MTRSFRRLVALLVTSAAGAAPLAAQQGLPPDLDAYVERVMARFKVPGLALTVVRDGKVLLAKGYGTRVLGKNDPVTPHTTFGIASNTKAFTATALGLLVDQGKIGWDDKVTDYLPWFRMSDPFVTANLTIRDLLTHRSGLGLGAGDLLIWPSTDYARDEIVRRLRNVPLATSFRGTYAYDNVLYLVAGEVIGAVSGTSWENFIRERIFAPLDMRDATVNDGVRLPASSATPHAPVNGTMAAVAPSIGPAVNPAGGINASADDMAKWLLVQLDSGRVAGKAPLFSPRVTRQLWREVTPMQTGTPPPALAPARATFNGYALGFGIRDWRGHQMLTHDGGLAGYVSRTTFFPAERTGIAILTNAESGETLYLLQAYLSDWAVGAPAFDWFTPVVARATEQAAQDNADPDVPTVPRDTLHKPSLPLERYAGTFRDAWYGDVIVTHTNGKLTMRFTHSPALNGELIPWGRETFVARWTDRAVRGDAFVTYHLGPDGAIESVKMKAVSPAVDFSYDYHDLLLKPVPRTP